MTSPNRKLWQGAAQPLSHHTIGDCAAELGCEPAALHAVWEVEAAGRCFEFDGSLPRRFEPHHLPAAVQAESGFAPRTGEAAWRTSLRLGAAVRAEMFELAYARDPEAALRATSWGAPQIMGFNCREAGFETAEAMVRAMADTGAAQLQAFVTLIRNWGLDSALRAQDWAAFARRYNGSGQVAEYARRMEAAYRRHAGVASPSVLRVGDRGAAVRELQAALGIVEDAVFGPRTLAAVEAFQRESALAVDGVVGRRTWQALADRAAAAGETPPLPGKQSTPLDAVLEQLGEVTAAAGALATATSGLRAALPEDAFAILLTGGLAFGAIATGAWAWRWARS